MLMFMFSQFNIILIWKIETKIFIIILHLVLKLYMLLFI